MTSQPPSEREDEGGDVLAALRHESRRTSAGHDERVLAAARGVAAERARRRRAPAWFPAAASFAALALVAAGLFTFLPRGPAHDTFRGADAEVSPPDGALLTAAPAELSWPPEAGVAGYRLVLRDSAARPLWTSTLLSAPGLRLPAQARQEIASAGTYLWTVEIENGMRGELGPYSFRIDGD